jgi:hypothetical protein
VRTGYHFELVPHQATFALSGQHTDGVLEYLLATDDDDFLGPVLSDRCPDVLQPTGWEAVPVAGDGDYRIAVDGMEIEFAWEMPGLQVTVHGTPDKPTVDELMATIARQVGAELAVRVRVVLL